MPLVEVRDYALWVKHIHGSEELQATIREMPERTVLQLSVDGETGWWEKMVNGADGRPTDGLKPIGPAKQHWAQLQTRRGDLVSIERVGQ